jgi:hypothetical protein
MDVLSERQPLLAISGESCSGIGKVRAAGTIYARTLRNDDEALQWAKDGAEGPPGEGVDIRDTLNAMTYAWPI